MLSVHALLSFSCAEPGAVLAQGKVNCWLDSAFGLHDTYAQSVTQAQAA